ncbi:MAG: hypothetical protein Q9199_005097 [Rusavskia elegans]
MLNILIASATLAVLAILAAFNPGNVLQTIAAGVEHTFSPGAAWENPFTKTSFIDLADASVALFADHVWPALIPGSTGTGRPYVVDLSTLANLTELNTVNMSDPLVYVQMLRESMTWVDREPFTEALVIRGILLIILTLSILIITGTMFIRSNSARLDATVSGLRDVTSRNAPALGFLERLCNMTNANELKTIPEPLRQLSTEIRTAASVSYIFVPGQTKRFQKLTSELAAHIDFVLHTIDSANDRYNASVEAKQLLEAKTEELNNTLAKYDELLVVCDNLRVQLSQKIQELENHDRKARESVISRRELQNALHAKIVDYDKLDGKLGTFKGALLNSNTENGNLRNSLQEKIKGYDAVVKQLEQANTKCNDLDTALTNVQGDLQGANHRCGDLEVALKTANDRWDAFSRGPSGIEDASNTALPGPVDGELEGLRENAGDATSLHKPNPSSGSAIAPSTAALNPAAQNLGPVCHSQSMHSNNPARWRSEEQAKEVHDQLLALQRAQLFGQFPAYVSRSSPAMTRRNSMGSVSPASGFAAPSFRTFAARSSAFDQPQNTSPPSNGSSASSPQHAPLAPKPEPSSDTNGLANKNNRQGQTDQPSSSVSKPPAPANNGSASSPHDNNPTPAPDSTTAGPEAGFGNAMDTNAAPTPEQRPGVPPAEGTTDSTAKPTSAPQGTDSSTPGPVHPRGRSATRSNPSNTGAQSPTPTNVSRLGDRPPVSPKAPPPDRSRGSPIRSTTGCVFEAARKRMADGHNGTAINGPGDAPATYQGGYNPQPGRGGGRGSAPSYRGGDFNHGGYSPQPEFGRGRGSCAPSDRGWDAHHGRRGFHHNRGRDLDLRGQGSTHNRGGNGGNGELSAFMQDLLRNGKAGTLPGSGPASS